MDEDVYGGEREVVSGRPEGDWFLPVMTARICPSAGMGGSLGLVPSRMLCRKHIQVRSTRCNTSSQCPALSCLYSFTVGYQGLSVLSNSQRQQVSIRLRTHTGLPNAPAK